MSSSQTTQKVYQALAQSLVDHEIGTLFGLMGDANLFMVDSFVREHKGHFVPAAHEANAVLMAHGYAQARATVGVATVTHGPGLTNTATALAEAARSHTPLVLLAGDTPVENDHHAQSYDQRALVATTGAGFEQLRSPASALKDLATAFRRAAMEQRPIVLNMPLEYQWAETSYVRTVFDIPDRRAYLPASEDLDKAAGIIATARRPIVLAGRGAIAAREELIRLAERIEAPLATTLRARNLFHGAAFNLGICGTLSTPVAAEEILGADCIIAFGAALTAYTQGGGNRERGTMLDGKRVIHVELDPRQIGVNFEPTVALVGDAARTAQRLRELLDEAELPGSGYRSVELQQAIDACQLEPRIPGHAEHGAPGTIDARQALLHLDRALPQDRVLVTDVGRFMVEAWQAVSVPDPRQFVHAAAFTAIGTGTGTAIGAAVGAGKPTVLVAGDGGFMMGGLADLHAAVQHKLDLTVIVCNDCCYGAEHMQFHARDMDTGMSRLHWPELAPIAQALGYAALAVHDEASLEAAAELIRQRKGPVFIELKVDADYARV